MVKEVYFFTQMGYTAYPQDKAKEAGYSNLLFSNKHFSPERASELYGMYFDEFQHASESGFDGVQLNEHHSNPLNMMPSINVIGAVMSKWTKKGKIVFLGNILPVHQNPLRLAEELGHDRRYIRWPFGQRIRSRRRLGEHGHQYQPAL